MLTSPFFFLFFAIFIFFIFFIFLFMSVCSRPILYAFRPCLRLILPVHRLNHLARPADAHIGEKLRPMDSLAARWAGYFLDIVLLAYFPISSECFVHAFSFLFLRRCKLSSHTAERMDTLVYFTLSNPFSAASLAFSS
jgi:hypothetical protein